MCRKKIRHKQCAILEEFGSVKGLAGLELDLTIESKLCFNELEPCKRPITLRRSMFKLFLSTIVLSSSVFATNAIAQAQQNQQQAPAGMQQQTTQNAPSEDQVEKFAVSLVKVEEVKQGLQAELSERPENEVNDELLQQVNAKFQQEATEIISAEGLSVDEYSGMINLMQQDQQFLAMVQQKVEEVQSK